MLKYFFIKFLGLYLFTAAVFGNDFLTPAERVDYPYRFHSPIKAGVLIFYRWQGEVEFSSDENLGSISIWGNGATNQKARVWSFPFYHAPLKTLQASVSNGACRGTLILTDIYSNGDLRYEFWPKLKTGCFAQAQYIELGANGNEAIRLSVIDAESNIIFSSSLNAIERSPTYDQQLVFPESRRIKQELIPLSKNKIKINSQLMSNADSYIGFWQGTLNNEELGFVVRYESEDLQSRAYGKLRGTVISPDTRCMGGFLMNHRSKELPLRETDKADFVEWANRINTSSGSSVHNSSDNCTKKSVISNSGVRLEFNMFLVSRDKAKANIMIKEGKNIIKNIQFDLLRAPISKKYSDMMLNSYRFNHIPKSPIMELLENPLISYSQYRVDQESFKQCVNGALCKFMGGEYLTAIYELNEKKMTAIEYNHGEESRSSILKDIVGDYLYHYGDIYRKCITGEYKKITKRLTIEEEWSSDTVIEFEYTVPPKFYDACQGACVYRGFSDFIPMGSLLERKTSKGIPSMMRAFSCDDPVIVKFEKNLLEAYSKSYR